MILSLARIVIYSFIVLATVITIVNFDHTVIMIVKILYFWPQKSRVLVQNIDAGIVGKD